MILESTLNSEYPLNKYKQAKQQILVAFAQARHMYEEMAMKLRDYEMKKYASWKAVTERNLPLLIKRPLLVMTTSISHIQVELHFISFCVHTSNH